MKIKFFLLSISALFLMACNSDDNQNAQQLEINETNLLGKWYLKGGTANGGPFENYDNECPTHRDYQEFLLDDDLIFHGANYQCADDIETSKWYLSGNELTVFSYLEGQMDYQDTFLIESITTEELILIQTVTEPEGEFVYRIHATRS
ncbi:hypothetical protein [Flavobacterium sp.]|uniref:hypothetical protein n=1 Tax=Flavobacterium sp. TaxID=239 RepID=UPI0028BE8708|nr:hypothetical protein [Flavobacterium sp.]